jgi:hypothetical protein
MGRERRESEEKCLEGEKRKRTGEKRYKEKVNKKVDGRRKRKPEGHGAKREKEKGAAIGE